MTEPLLLGNRRIGSFFAGLAVVGIALGIGCYLTASGPFKWFALAGCLLSALLLIPSIWICLFPRLAISDDELLVYLRSGSPFRVPLDAVEVFFIGQGAVKGEEPGHPHGYQGAVAANVIVRLAEAATEWKQRDVNQPLGVWADGYITLRGLWCENIDAEVLKRMNRRLAEIKRQRRDTMSAAANAAAKSGSS